MGADGGNDGVVVDEADMVTTVVAEAVAELKEGMVTSCASEASSPQCGQKSMLPLPPPLLLSVGLLRPPLRTVTQPRWKRWAMRWSGQHSRNVPCGGMRGGEVNVKVSFRVEMKNNNRCSPISRRIHSQDSSDAAPCVSGARRTAP